MNSWRNGRKAPVQERPLLLTGEEALALIQVCLLSPVKDDTVNARMLDKLGGLCREFLREEASH